MFLKSSVTYLVNNYSVLPISDSQKDDLVAVGSLSGPRLAVVVPSQNATNEAKIDIQQGFAAFLLSYKNILFTIILLVLINR